MPLHPISPIFDENSRILILGSFPSVKSRQQLFYYAHPQNRFWPLIARLCGVPCPTTADEKTALLLRHGIALWDVIASCSIEGSADTTITDVVPNDISIILNTAHISRVFTNGGKANELYRKYILPVTGIEAIALPSTSPANASFTLDKLADKWHVITEYITNI